MSEDNCSSLLRRNVKVCVERILHAVHVLRPMPRRSKHKVRKHVREEPGV